ncbi:MULTISPECIES: carbohydrate ABC transporter permease [unclassified Serinicoccus]|uniref:carbohydrate ABC transporter permease n=1 Tax=unclassified Serinicoccus TaxID=2643101 RepID=UPI003852D703
MRRREYWMLLAPSLVVMIGLLALPLVRTLQWSLQRVTYGTPGEYVGLSNYTQALTDERFLRSVGFTVGLTLSVFVVVVIGGYVLAIAVNDLRKSRPLVLGILLVSYVIPQVIGATMFGWLFDRNFGGIVNFLVRETLGWSVLWYTDVWPNRVLLALAVIWGMLPFAMLVIMAGLQGISKEMMEAARVDGASKPQIHWHVIIPSLRGVLGFVSLIVIMDVLRVFDQLIPLSPQAVQIGNESVMLYIYNMAFRDGGQQLGLGSAINLLLIVIIFVLLIPFIRDVAKEGSRR